MQSQEIPSYFNTANSLCTINATSVGLVLRRIMIVIPDQVIPRPSVVNLEEKPIEGDVDLWLVLYENWRKHTGAKKSSVPGRTLEKKRTNDSTNREIYAWICCLSRLY
jgi:hypothetical protein